MRRVWCDVTRVSIALGLSIAFPTLSFAMEDRPSNGWEVAGAAGLRVDYPTSIFAMDAGPATKGVGKIFRSSNGGAGFTYYVDNNADHLTPNSFLRRHVRVEGLQVDYLRQAKDFVVVSGVRQEKIFYSRCNFPQGSRGPLHCIELIYDRDEKSMWDTIVTRISLSLR
jgi:hypothetical protein